MIIADLRGLGIHRDGSIALRRDRLPDLRARRARRSSTPRACRRTPSSGRRSRRAPASRSSSPASSSSSWSSPALLAAMGIYQNSAILIVGAMVVGPEFGPLAGLCVALVQRHAGLARRSARALVVGFALAIATVYVTTRLFRAIGLFDDDFSLENHSFANLISSPDFFTFFVAACAGRGRDAEPQHREVGRADRRPDQRHDDPRRRERRRGGRLRGLGHLRRQPRAARHQPGRRSSSQASSCSGSSGSSTSAGAQAARRARPHTDEPSDDQISTFVLILLDHGVGELGRRGRAAEVERLDAARGRLQRRLVDRARGALRARVRPWRPPARAPPRRRGSSPSGWPGPCPGATARCRAAPRPSRRRPRSRRRTRAGSTPRRRSSRTSASPGRDRQSPSRLSAGITSGASAAPLSSPAYVASISTGW